MKRLSNLFGKPQSFIPHQGTSSTDDLSPGFGKRFIFASASKNGQTLPMSKPIDECWFDVSEDGITILDRDDNVLYEFKLTKINIFEAVGQTANAPAFQFTFHNGKGFDTYKFGTSQADSIFTVFNEAIQKARKTEKSKMQDE